MEQDRPSIDLSLATAEDMVAELERRGCASVLFFSYVRGGLYLPSHDVPPEGRERVIGDDFVSKNPAYKAAFLCDGIQLCLNELSDIMPRNVANTFDCVNLSKLVAVVKESFNAAAALTTPPRPK